MNTSIIAKALAATAGAVAIGIATAPNAAAYSTIEKFGTPERLYDAGGRVVTAWTVNDLRPSTDTIPAYPLHGRLWEATATVEAVRGTVTPIIPNLNARTNSGQNYQALWEAYMPTTVSGATIPQGARSTGKVYFDVVGADPTRVMYNNGVEDLLIWER